MIPKIRSSWLSVPSIFYTLASWAYFCPISIYIATISNSAGSKSVFCRASDPLHWFYFPLCGQGWLIGFISEDPYIYYAVLSVPEYGHFISIQPIFGQCCSSPFFTGYFTLRSFLSWKPLPWTYWALKRKAMEG